MQVETTHLIPAHSIPATDGGESHEILAGPANAGVVVLCDHASNAMPHEFDRLGMRACDLERHIAYDIGALNVSRALAAALACPAVFSRFSRLLIDPNRADDDPTLVMRLSDGAIVPGNAHIDAAAIAERMRRFSCPYHGAVTQVIDAMVQAGPAPAVVSVHSFTPSMKGVARPWHVGVLWDSDPRLPVPLIERLRQEPGLIVGDNEPYHGALEGDTMSRHATARGLPHVLVEIRQDLIASPHDATRWGQRLAGWLEPVLMRCQQVLRCQQV